MDYELLLFDRIEVIKATDKKYDLEHNAYLSFSGGKDSTILHYLLDMALPNNNIPRVFINTGIEYNYIVEFVKELASKDKRFVIVQPKTPIKKMLEEKGYPFKSKVFSNCCGLYQRLGKTRSVQAFLGEATTKKGVEKKGQFLCPPKLKEIFTENYPLKISDRCCWELKKYPSQDYEQQSGRHITLTGMRKQEGGSRIKLTCIINDKKGHIKSFHPLVKVDSEWEKQFIEENHIQLCKLYYPPFNFKRTGCKGCPYALDLAECLDIMEEHLPLERKQCEAIWKPVYDEYRRLGYRLKSKKQLSLLEE